ncbi:unnamed protein product [Ilex paraguariensis]|uniref:RNase H type-1 domain-containing protein n=1 Tax=Ilex paraguariensis TaxID=185542 RepID=A0ABC8R0L7_9AQUA
MVAEYKALLDGLQLIFAYGLFGYSFVIECDSLVLVNSGMGACDCPWTCLGYLRQIRCLLKQLQHRLVHVYREANSVADRLAAQAVMSGWSSNFTRGFDCLVRLGLLC